MEILVVATSLYNDPAAEDWQPDLRSTVAYLRRNNINIGFTYEPVLSRAGVVERCGSLAPRLLFLELSEETRAPVLEFAASFKIEQPDTLIAVGGTPATFLYSDFLQHYQSIDLIVAGERDVTLLETAERLQRGDSLDCVAGLQSRRFHNPPRSLISHLDCLEGMAHDGLAELVKPYPPRERIGYLASSRGCYANCSFCGVPGFFRYSGGDGWRGRSPRSVVSELRNLSEAFEIRQFVFVDDNFIGPGSLGQERARQIATEIVRSKLDIEYSMCCRLTDVREATFELLMESGLRCVGVSIEATNQSSLNLLGKGMKTEVIYPTLDLLEHMGLRCEVNLIFFDPYVTLDGVRNNLALLEYLRNSKYLSYSGAFPFNELTAFPWSRVASILRKDGLLGVDGRCRFQDPRVARLVEFVRNLRGRISCCFKKRLLFDNDCLTDLARLSPQASAAVAFLTAGLRRWIGLDVLPRTLRAACNVLEGASSTVERQLSELESSFENEIALLRTLERGICEMLSGASITLADDRQNAGLLTTAHAEKFHGNDAPLVRRISTCEDARITGGLP